jgi:hypothetical protein
LGRSVGTSKVAVSSIMYIYVGVLIWPLSTIFLLYFVTVPTV